MQGFCAARKVLCSAPSYYGEPGQCGCQQNFHSGRAAIVHGDGALAPQKTVILEGAETPRAWNLGHRTQKTQSGAGTYYSTLGVDAASLSAGAADQLHNYLGMSRLDGWRGKHDAIMKTAFCGLGEKKIVSASTRYWYNMVQNLFGFTECQYSF